LSIVQTTLVSKGIVSLGAYGYADNWPNNDVRAQTNIDWAVDADGAPVRLKGIGFAKVYAGAFR
jgi:hypothetical protein